jgi:hypothetical protein
MSTLHFPFWFRLSVHALILPNVPLELHAQRTVATQTFAEQMSAKCPMLTKKAVYNDRGETVVNGNRVNQLCDAISGKARKETNPAIINDFKFEDIVYEAAGVKSADTEQQIARKVQVFWHINKKGHLRCTSNHFGVDNGNIIKFAAKKKFSEFIYSTCWDWGVDLDLIDETDGKTLADFIRDELKSSRGTVNEPFLREYFDIIRAKGGGKFRSEIEATLELASEAYGKENLGSHGQGLVIVKNAGKWGLADQAAKLIVPCEYDEIIILGKDYFAVRKGDPKFFFINRENKKVPGPWDDDKPPAGKTEK